jgi:flagellar motor switch protein FliM
MDKVLSQDEVDSLLQGITGGKVETETAIPEGDEGIKVYDFREQTGPSTLKLPALGPINERFVGSLKKSLSAVAGWAVNVNLTSTEPVKFNDFCLSLPLPTSLNIFRLEPLRGLALLVLEASLVFSFVESFLGGRGAGRTKVEGRDFTKIELLIIEKLVKLMLNDLQQAWSEVHEVEMLFVRTEMDPQFAEIVAPSDMAISMKFAIDLENASGFMTLCMPFSTIESIRDKLTFRHHSTGLEVDQRWRKHIEEKIRQLKINMNCTLGMTRIRGRDLLEMKVNDVIQLDQRTNDPIIVSVEGIPKFMGYPGTYNKRRAVRIEERVRRE